MTEHHPKENDNSIATDSKRREKKETKKKRKRDDEENVHATIEKEIDVSQDRDDDTFSTKSKSKELLKQRRFERQKLLDLVPKVDENGISYTKQQIRLMRKRVQKGLHPIETSAEKHNRLVEEARIRKEVEAELAGFDNNNRDDKDEEDDNNTDDDNNNDTDLHENDDEGLSKLKKFQIGDDVSNTKNNDDEDYSYEKRPSSTVGDEPAADRCRPIKKKKREKPVPSDYICSACKGTNNDQPDRKSVV